LAIGIVVFSPMASASILGACNATPGQTVVMGGCDATATGAGTLLATLTAPFTSTLGTSSGTLISAVYRESGGTLDFYYQVIENTTAPNCGGGGQPACDPISRETDTNFSTWLTNLGFRTDGGNTSASTGMGASDPFTNGTGGVQPQTADRNASPGDVIGFTFNAAPSPTPIQPGQTSYVLIISTNATLFTNGNASVIDGGVTTVASFEPFSGTPEPASFALLGFGLVVLGGLSRRITARRKV